MAPLLGAWALVEIRRNPQRHGTRLAVAGIVLGIVAMGGWGLAARWWHVHARMPMITGPGPQLAAAQAGDLAAFKDAFAGPGRIAPDDEALAFVAEVSGRYGRLLGSGQARPGPDAAVGPPAPAPQGAAATGRRLRIPYTFRFESGPVEAEAQFILFDEAASGPVLGFGWLVLHDDSNGDLVYPESARAAALMTEPEPAE